MPPVLKTNLRERFFSHGVTFFAALARHWKCRVLFLLFLLFTLAAPLHARPQVLIVLADGLTLADVTRPDLPHFVLLRRDGALALMSPGLAAKPEPIANVYATLGAGDTVRVGDKSQGRLADALRRAEVRTALVGDVRPNLFLPSPDMTLSVTPDDPMQLWAATRQAFQTCDLVAVRLPSSANTVPMADAYLGLVMASYDGPLFFVVPTPPLQPDGTWNSLAPFLARLGPNSSLSSDTTQTPGLVASRDVAPTLLHALQIPIPLQMTGAVVRSVPSVNLARMDRLTRLNQEAQNAIFWAVGLVAGVIVFGTLGLYLRGCMRGHVGSVTRYSLRLLCAWPLALLIAPLADPSTVNGYLTVIGLLVLTIALLPSPALIFGLTALVLIGDGLTGTTLVSNSALSEYALSGIRFYGIGNEYMGVLIGGALLIATIVPGTGSAGLTKAQSASGTEDKPTRTFPQSRSDFVPLNSPALPVPGLLAFFFILVTFVLSFPAFGAKAGGAVTATATFVVAWRLLYGRPVTWKHLVGSIALGFALVFLWAVLSHWLHLRRTHLETATEALGQGRFGYILGVSLRKIGLAVRVALHPGTLLGLLAFGGLWLAIRKLLWRQVTAYLAPRPRETAILRAGLWGCLVALLFNDSGVVAAILILQCLALLLLHGLYSEPRESIHAPARA